MSGSWLVPWQPRPHAGRNPMLLCVPPAGAGCGQFRSWQTELGGDVSVVGVQLPGRENRWADPEASTVDEAVAAIVAELAELVPPDHPIVVFGHSFGALLGYEIAKRLWRDRGRWPGALVVAGCRPPWMWVGAGRGLVDDAEELTRLLDARGLDPADLDDDTRDLLVDVLRRDARLSLSYADRDQILLGCPLEAWGGDADTTVTTEQVAGWRGYAGEDFVARTFTGGHYFCLDDPRQAVALLGPMVQGQFSQPRRGSS